MAEVGTNRVSDAALAMARSDAGENWSPLPAALGDLEEGGRKHYLRLAQAASGAFGAEGQRVAEDTATSAGVHLAEVRSALEQARACLMGQTPDGVNPNEAWGLAMEGVRAALLEHLPAIEGRLSR